MTEAKKLELNAKMTETDLAYYILRQTACPQYYRDLINRVLEIKSPDMIGEITAIVAVYTQINLDTRFAHFGDGLWGLKVWLPGKNTRRVPLIALLHKSADSEDLSHLNDKIHTDSGTEEEEWED